MASVDASPGTNLGSQMASRFRPIVICRAPEDSGLAAALHHELAERAIDGWPSGPDIAAGYASAELIARLTASDGLVVVATPATTDWPFAPTAMRLARELGRSVLILAVGFDDDILQAWLRQLPVEPNAVRVCADVFAAALAVEDWTPRAADLSPPVVEFAAARAELLRVASHGGRIRELAASGVDPALLKAAALHLRAIGLIDFAGPLDDERTTFIVVG
jgi:hypothetical protein